MKRGDVVVAAGDGDYGKPRPMVIVQSDTAERFDTVTVALITTTLLEAPNTRPSINPSTTNGLREMSEVMIDKIQPVRRTKVGAVIGRLSDDDMDRVTRSLATFLGIAD
jgi:mRNA interferase MazF